MPCIFQVGRILEISKSFCFSLVRMIQQKRGASGATAHAQNDILQAGRRRSGLGRQRSFEQLGVPVAQGVAGVVQQRNPLDVHHRRQAMGGMLLLPFFPRCFRRWLRGRVPCPITDRNTVAIQLGGAQKWHAADDHQRAGLTRPATRQLPARSRRQAIQTSFKRHRLTSLRRSSARRRRSPLPPRARLSNLCAYCPAS